MLRLLVLSVLAAGCHFSVDSLELDGESGEEAGVPGDDASPGDDAAIPDLASADHALTHDFSGLPDGLVPGGIGWPCQLGADCTAGLCVDGFCCDSLCDQLAAQNLCKACNVPGFEGRCSLVLDGTDPRSQCDAEAATTCGRDGTCDGKGACRQWVAGTACTAPSCASGKITYAAGCDGLGHCGAAPAPVSCAPFKCAGASACDTTCSGSPQCAAPAMCTGGSCGPRALGQPCFAGGDCASGNCAQGVCCATACTGACSSCATPGTIGTCSPVPSGGLPTGTCTAQTRESCGLDGKCDGAGFCRKWVLGTPCAGPTCADAKTTLSARACDGAGTCSPGVLGDCNQYACNPVSARCFQAPCTSDAQCSGTNTCQSNATCN